MAHKLMLEDEELMYVGLCVASIVATTNGATLEELTEAKELILSAPPHIAERVLEKLKRANALIR